MKRLTFLVIGFTLFSKFFGFGREIALSFFYGTSFISDSYLISIIIPGVVFGFIASGISLGYIPMLNKIYLKENNNEANNEANKFTNDVINLMILLSTIIVVLCLIFSRQIVNIFAPGFNEESMEITIKLTRINLFSIYFTSLFYIYSGYLQSTGSYYLVSLAGLPYNLTIILSIALSKIRGLNWLSYGFIAATIIQALTLFPLLKKRNYKYGFSNFISNKYLNDLLKISIPLILGFSINQINLLVDKAIASKFLEGSISSLNYSSKLNNFFLGVIIFPFNTIFYPIFSKLFEAKKNTELSSIINKSILFLLFFTIPFTIFIISFSEEITRILFYRGEFKDSALKITKQSLELYILGLLGFGLRDLISRIFYVIHDSKTPMYNSAFGMILNIVLNIVLSKIMGVSGLALATSISATITSLLLLFRLQKNSNLINFEENFINFLKIFLASMGSLFLCKLLQNYIGNAGNININTILIFIFGVINYLVIIYLMKIKIFNEFLGKILKQNI